MSQGIVKSIELEGHHFSWASNSNRSFAPVPTASHPLFNAFLQAALRYADDGSQLRLNLLSFLRKQSLPPQIRRPPFRQSFQRCPKIFVGKTGKRV
jgi:hypothetical protein